MKLKKLELRQETVKNLTRKPEGREAKVDVTFRISCPSHCVSCVSCNPCP